MFPLTLSLFGDTVPDTTNLGAETLLLKPFQLVLLTALAVGESNGYQISQQMIQDIAGVIVISSWQVYRELPRLVDRGMIERVQDTYPARYRLGQHGRKMLMSERGQALHYYKLLQERL
jgi:DNA-binding PadR family transcriptional regulator